MITPGIGAMLYFTPINDYLYVYQGNPLAAIVACVRDDGLLNIAVFDANGGMSNRQGVALQQPGTPPPLVSYCSFTATETVQQEAGP